jgi:AcrR family transcriptional regulator
MAKLSPKDSVKLKRVELYRQLIVEAAEAEFAEHGFEAAKMQHIAQRAGIALGTLYGVFPGKSEVYDAVQALRGREILEHMFRQIPGTGDFLDAALRGIAAYARFLVERPNYLRMHLREGLSWADRAVLKSGEQVDTWERGMALAEDVLARGIERGLLISNDSPGLQIKMLIAAHQVQLRDWLERGAKPEEVDDLIERMQSHFCRAFVRDEHAARGVRGRTG